MNRRILIGFAAICALAAPQGPAPGQTDDQSTGGARLPNGRSQREEILKADHAKSLRDAAELSKLAEEFQAELEKNDRHVLSVSTLKKLDEIEKLTKRLRSRLKRY